MRRRGHIPTLLLFAEGLVLMMVVWFGFLSQKGDVTLLSEPIKSGLVQLEHDQSYLQQQVVLLTRFSLGAATSSDFENHFRNSFEQRATSLGELLPRETNLFALIRTHNYTLTHVGDLYVLTLHDVFVHVQPSNSRHEFTRWFDITVRFNQTSILSSS